MLVGPTVTNWRRTQPVPHCTPASGAEQPPGISPLSLPNGHNTQFIDLKVIQSSAKHSRSQLYRSNMPRAQCMHSTYILSLGENTLLDSFPGPNLRLKTPNDVTS